MRTAYVCLQNVRQEFCCLLCLHLCNLESFVVLWGSPSLQFNLSFFLDYILKPKSGPGRPGPIINSIDSFFIL